MKAVRAACFAVAGLIAATGLAPAQELKPGEMRDTVWAACNTCHRVTRFMALRKTRPEWVATLNDMINKGAVIGDDEFDRIVDYLTKNYGK